MQLYEYLLPKTAHDDGNDASPPTGGHVVVFEKFSDPATTSRPGGFFVGNKRHVMKETDYKIGRAYRLKIDGSYYLATLMEIDTSVRPERAHVIIREHSVDSFHHISSVRKRHTKHSEAIPCADVLLTDLQP